MRARSFASRSGRLTVLLATPADQASEQGHVLAQLVVDHLEASGTRWAAVSPPDAAPSRGTIEEGNVIEHQILNERNRIGPAQMGSAGQMVMAGDLQLTRRCQLDERGAILSQTGTSRAHLRIAPVRLMAALPLLR
jgi:hypothetical protein